MSTIINGTSSAITFPDATVQNTAGLPLSGGTLTGALTVPTLNAPSGVLATQNGMTGIAKAWVSFTGSTAVINASFNVSSITRNGNGDYTVNFTTAMPSANYVCAGMAVYTGGFSTLSFVSGTIATSSFRFFNLTSSGTSSDSSTVTVATFGA